MKVSVIIPMYKVSKFIERCAETLMRQTLQDVEFIFVDDASPDDSRVKLEAVLAEYPERNVRILTHERNQGLPAARNTGLAAATGEYIFHCDGDDFVEPDLLEKMYDAAVREKAEYLWCDFYSSYETNERYMETMDLRTPGDLLRRGLFSGRLKFNVWNKLVSRSLYERTAEALAAANTAATQPIDIRIFPTGHPMAEDMTMILLALCAKSVARVPYPLYHYVKTNSGAMTQTFSQKQLDDIRFNVDRVENFTRACRPGEFDDALQMFKLSVKLPFLLSGDKAHYKLWKEWYPETDRYAFANPEQPLRNKILQWMAAHGQWWYVTFYYKFVFNLRYGVLYK